MSSFAIPLRTRFRGIDVRTGLLLRGESGWGEFSPFADYRGVFAARWLRSAVEAMRGEWPAPRRERVAVNVVVPEVAPEDAYALVAASGCSTAKVKVGDAEGEARVEAVRDALGPAGAIRVDVNGAWDVDTAVRRLRRLARYGLEYAEQPVATVDELAELRRRVDVPLAIDESLRRAADPLRVDVAAAADVAVLKVAPLGGVVASLRIAESVGVPCVVSSALETSVGLAAGVALAAALPELPYACGLGTATLLAGDVVADPLVPVEGHVAVRRPVPDAAALARWSPAGPSELSRLARQLDEAKAEGGT